MTNPFYLDYPLVFVARHSRLTGEGELVLEEPNDLYRFTGSRIHMTGFSVEKPSEEHKVCLRWSDTGGETWSNAVSQTLGVPGDYDCDVQWRRLGMARDRIWELSWSSTIATSLAGAFLQFDVAGT